MKNHIAVVTLSDNKVTKFQDFDAADDAAAHVASYGGFVAAKPDGTIDHWTVDADKKTLTFDKSASDTAANHRTVMSEIHRLEALETPRRLAESVLSGEGKTWLTANRDKIATERGKL